jgi:predicted nucleic acid-binding protein
LEGGATRSLVHFDPIRCAGRSRYAVREQRARTDNALILSAAADAGCWLLLSEDLQAGFTWRGVRVVDPFAKKMDVRLKRVMGG